MPADCVRATFGGCAARTGIFLVALNVNSTKNRALPRLPRRVAPGSVQAVLSYCHYCLNDTSLLRQALRACVTWALMLVKWLDGWLDGWMAGLVYVTLRLVCCRCIKFCDASQAQVD